MGSEWQVAPHGILAFAAFAFAILILFHVMGFRAVVAAGVGK